jgi:hypothetical protein
MRPCGVCGKLTNSKSATPRCRPCYDAYLRTLDTVPGLTMKRRRQSTKPTSATTPVCRKAPEDQGHHWLLEEAQGPTSWGTCKWCGAKRQFANWDEAWEEMLAVMGGI